MKGVSLSRDIGVMMGKRFEEWCVKRFSLEAKGGVAPYDAVDSDVNRYEMKVRKNYSRTRGSWDGVFVDDFD